MPDTKPETKQETAIRHAGTLPPWKIEALLGRYTLLMEQEVRRHMPILHRLGLGWEDAMQVARIAVIEAPHRHDPERSSEQVYVRRNIRWALGNLATDSQWGPKALNEWNIKINRVHGYLSNRLGRAPTAAEMAEPLGLTEDRVSFFLGLRTRTYTSLDQPVHEESEGSLYGDVIPDDAPPVDAQVDLNRLRRRLVAIMDTLTAREVFVVECACLEGWRLSDIGRQLGLSRERARQIREKALMHMHRVATDTEADMPVNPEVLKRNQALRDALRVLIAQDPGRMGPELFALVPPDLLDPVPDASRVKALRLARMDMGVHAKGQGLSIDGEVYRAACERYGFALSPAAERIAQYKPRQQATPTPTPPPTTPVLPPAQPAGADPMHRLMDLTRQVAAQMPAAGVRKVVINGREVRLRYRVPAKDPSK